MLTSVVVDQTAFQNDLSFIICQITDFHFEFPAGISCHVNLDFFSLLLNSFSDSRKKQIIAFFKRQAASRDQKGEHTPIDQVGPGFEISVIGW